MVDLVRLPYRQYGTATSLDTTVPVLGQDGRPRYYGRKIELYPFITGEMYKYKLIEQVGDKLYERIFLAPSQIETGEWWQEDNTFYPIQLKVISPRDTVVGYSHKYAAGISNYLSDRQSDGMVYVPTMTLQWDGIDPTLLEAGSRVIPSNDSVTISHDWTRFRRPPYDPWLIDDVYLSQLYFRLRRGDIGCSGLVSLGNVVTYQNATNCYDTDPIDNNWYMYDLLALLSDLVISDIELTIDGSQSEVGVTFNSRYNLDIRSDRQKEYAASKLKEAALRMAMDKFKSTYWTKLVITKTWAEEVYIDVYERQSPDVISTVMYVDLPIFALGTVGLSPLPT